MPAIQFPVSSAPGAAQQEGSGRLINAYVTKTEQGARAPFIWQRSAGLREILNITGHSHFRGGVYVGSTLLVVLDQRVYAVTLTGTVFSAVNLGALAGTDAVTIAVNRAGTPNIALACEAGTFNLYTGSGPDGFADGDWPAVNSVTGANGYIVGSTGSGQIWSTDLNAVTVESDANVDAQMPLRRVVYFREELFAMGPFGIKVYDETGESPFPFQYKKVNIARGICGTHAVAGYEDGWAKELLWVGEDNVVYQLDGYTPVAVSNEAVSRAIAGSSDRTLIEASVYMKTGNAFFVITMPGEWTWEYNATTKLWNERRSWERDDWRGRRAIRAFDRWIVGDAATGKFAEIDGDFKREYGDHLIWHMESGDNASFPSRIAVSRVDLDFTAALGRAAGEDPVETDPAAMISWSLDGGYTWGAEVRRRLGKQGEGGKLVTVTPVGVTKGKGIRFRLRVSDPVHVTFHGGQMAVSGRAA